MMAVVWIAVFAYWCVEIYFYMLAKQEAVNRARILRHRSENAMLTAKLQTIHAQEVTMDTRRRKSMEHSRPFDARQWRIHFLDAQRDHWVNVHREFWDGKISV